MQVAALGEKSVTCDEVLLKHEAFTLYEQERPDIYIILLDFILCHCLVWVFNVSLLSNQTV